MTIKFLSLRANNLSMVEMNVQLTLESLDNFARLHTI